MIKRIAIPSAIAWACFVAGWCLPPAAPALAQHAPAASADNWSQDLLAWRAQQERKLSAPDGWLTLIGLEWLKPGFNSVGAAADNQIQVHAQAPAHIAVLTVSANPEDAKPRDDNSQSSIVQLLAPSGGFPPKLTMDGNPAREGQLAVDGPKPSAVAWHGLTLVVLRRGDRFVLRIKDADSPTRTGFSGLNWYAPDPRFLIAAQWIPFTPVRIQKIPTVLGTTLDLPAPGLARFKLNGHTLSLEPVLEDPSGRTLFFILRDETSKTTTYGGGRFLHTGLPDHGLDQPGLLTLDFNRLENPPCAYTPYATCPLPPRQNQLPVALEAGEQRYAH
jgi:hypothetical protein